MVLCARSLPALDHSGLRPPRSSATPVHGRFSPRPHRTSTALVVDGSDMLLCMQLYMLLRMLLVMLSSMLLFMLLYMLLCMHAVVHAVVHAVAHALVLGC